MQRLIDPALVVIAMIVPTLNFYGFQEFFHGISGQVLGWRTINLRLVIAINTISS